MKRILFAVAAVAGLSLAGASAVQANDGFRYGGYYGPAAGGYYGSGHGYDPHSPPSHGGYGGHSPFVPPVYRVSPPPHAGYGHGVPYGGHRGVDLHTGNFSFRIGH